MHGEYIYFSSCYTNSGFTFETTSITAMDIWFKICMLHVAMAMFEYAILLTIKFGKQNKISAGRNVEEEKKAVKKTEAQRKTQKQTVTEKNLRH